VRAREVQTRIQALQASTMRPGDAMPLLSEVRVRVRVRV